MPYPRIHITNVRGHGIPPCPLCVFPPGDACSPHRTHLGGYGIPAIPTPPSQGVQRSPLHQPSTRAPTLQSSHRIHRIHRNFWQRRASHRFHRWFGCVGFCGKIVWCLRGYGRDAIPSYNCTDWGLKFCVFCAIRGKISQ